MDKGKSDNEEYVEDDGSFEMPEMVDLPSIDFDMPTMPDLPVWEDEIPAEIPGVEEIDIDVPEIELLPKEEISVPTLDESQTLGDKEVQPRLQLESESSSEPSASMSRTEGTDKSPLGSQKVEERTFSYQKQVPLNSRSLQKKPQHKKLKDQKYRIKDTYKFGHPINVAAYLLLIIVLAVLFRDTLFIVLLMVGYSFNTLSKYYKKRQGVFDKYLNLTEAFLIMHVDKGEELSIKWRNVHAVYTDSIREANGGLPVKETVYLCVQTKSRREFRSDISGLEEVNNNTAALTDLVPTRFYLSVVDEINKRIQIAKEKRVRDAGL